LKLIMFSCFCVFKGSQASVVVAVKQLKRYPVDLYYLVDVSASMQENLDHVGVYQFPSVLKLFINIVLRKTFFSKDIN